MSEESLIFSVFGLTVRGFDYNVDKWVPKEGQRLSCVHTSGAIDVLEDGESVGSVATEAPNKFKEWLNVKGKIEAVVVGVQKRHRGKKGMEVPVIYVFTSKKDCRMINLKRAITRDILKLKRKKMSLDIKEGDASKGMIFPDTNDNHFEFSISGMTMRGFDVYQNIWVPEKGDRILCSVSASKSVEMLKDGQTIGNVQTEGQKLFRKFINANGVLHAVVDADPKHHRSKGEEIPVIYQFSANDWTKRLQNIRNEIRNDIQKKSIRKKSLKFICSNEESQNEAGTSYGTHSEDMAGGSGESMSNTNTSEQMQHSDEAKEQNIKDEPELNSPNNENKAGGSGANMPKGEMSSEKVDTTQKRRSSESAGGSAEKIRKTFRVPEGKTPVKSSESSASKRTPKRSRSSPLTPVSTNRITNYFSPKTSESAESFFGNVQEPDTVKRRLEMEDEKKDGDRRHQEGDHGELKFNFVSSESKQPCGSFFDTDGHVESVLESDAKCLISRSVCKIFYPTVKGNATATGFRVGSRYVMTAAHVTKEFLEGLKFAKESYVIFNYKLDGISKEEDKYFINGVVYEEEETDIAVIDLLGDPSRMPPHVTLFCRPIIGRAFHLIGHSQGKIMETNHVTKTIDPKDHGNKLLFDQLQGRSLKHTNGTGYDSPPHDSIYNPRRFLFQCKFTKGASGCPGIVLIGKNVYVTTVLLHGYPDWYYDPKMEIYKSNWLDEHCIQQGVDPISVCEMMRSSHPDLCQDIFGPQEQE